MVKTYELVGGKLAQAPGPDGPVEVYSGLSDEERKHLIEVHRIDEHTLGSALDPDEPARLEFEPEHLAIIFKRPKRYSSEDNFLFKVRSAGFFLFADRIIIVVNDDIGLFEGRPFSRMVSVNDLLLRALFRAVQHFEEHLQTMSMISDELEDQVNKSMENKHLLNMFTLEKGLVYYLNAIRSNGRVLEKLKTGATKLPLTPDNIEYLDDLLIENNQCFEQANTYSQVLSSLMDARASLVSNNLNVLMKNLSAIVIAVAVPAFLAGVGGMSEFSMMTGVVHWTIAYPIFLLGSIAIGVATFFLIKRLERRWR